jgi:pimeloyl-ACP methyl ester carboxylesterase
VTPPDPVPDAVLEDLRRRLAMTRHPALPSGLGWERGMDPEYLAELVDHWAYRYDWREREARIHALPWADGVPALHQPAAHRGAPVAVLLHGWPDSILRFARVLPLLTDLDVVVPCLPGYPFGAPVTAPGMSTTAMGDAVVAMLDTLGVQRCVLSGGDIGSGVATAIAARYPERVGALHLTDVPMGPLAAIPEEELTAEERDYRDRARRWQRTEGGYMHEHATKPHTLAAALADSPAGLAAWIVEKLRSWSDCGGDVESVFPREDLLTWVTAYWVTGTIGSSFSPYVEPREPVGRLDVPTAVTLFPHDLVLAPRGFAERCFDLRVFREEPAGGHFAAWERPEAFADGLRAAVGLA